MTRRADEQLEMSAVADLAGIKYDTLDTYKRDGRAPQPDGYIGRSPWWWRSTIEHWIATRKTSPGREPAKAAK